MTLLKVDIRKKLSEYKLEASFEVSSAGFALLGSSGSGKSMTLKCIAGVETPDEGIITLGDKVLFDSSKKINVPSRKRKIGLLFQDYALFPNLTAFENIDLICRDKERTRGLLRRFGIENAADLRPDKMSGGQCQRTALARMLASDPEVILFDEPFSALDNYMHTLIEREIMDLLDSFEGPSILVSHDRNEVFRLCNRIGVIDKGKLTEIQDKEDFFNSPLSAAAARLTGCKNITRLRSDGFAEDWGIRLNIPSGRIPENIRYAGFRAHYFIRAGKEEKGTPGVFEAEVVRVIDDTFSRVILFRQKGNPVNTSDSVLTYITDKNANIEDLYLKTDPSRLMFFPR